MPQNAIIRADGTGDYTTLIAFEAGEQNSDYGARTVGRVDGFFDNGGSQLDFNGAWVNGVRLEPFDSADGFDGTERQLCGMTSTATITLRQRGDIDFEWVGLEVYNTGTGQACSTTGTSTSPSTYAEDCLFHSPGTTRAYTPGTTNGSAVNCVLYATRGYQAPLAFVNCTIFGDIGSTMGTNSSAASISDSVTVNAGAGDCYRVTVTQSNNAATDTTADAFDNIVVADEFVDPDPVTSGDWRIKAGGVLETNGIGAFIQSSGGITVTVQDISQSQTLDNIDLTQQSVLTLNELNQIQTVENVNLVSGSQLSIDELSQFQTIDNIDLTQGYSVSINEINQGQTLESILLTQNNNLTIEELTQLQTIDNLTLVTGDQILVSRLDQMQTLDNVEISQAGVILLNRVDQFQFIEQINLQALTPVTVQSLSQAQQLENITVTQLATLVQLNDATQNQTIDNINLLQTSIIQIDSLSQQQLLESINFGGVVVGYLDGELNVFYAYNGNTLAYNALTGETKILG